MSMSEPKSKGLKTSVEAAVENGEKLLAYSDLEWYFRRLAGEVLTIIDASVVEPKQNKAMKDLIKNEIREKLLGAQSFCWQGAKRRNVLVQGIEELG